MSVKQVLFDEETHIYQLELMTGKRQTVPSVTQFVGTLSADKYGGVNPSVMYQAQQRGTAVHELCESYDYEALPDEIDPEAAPFLKAYIAFCRDYRPEWLAIEHQVFSEDNLYAGRVDRIGIIDDVPCIVDLKTTASMDRSSKLALACQLAAYTRASNDMGIMPWIRSCDCIGVQLKKDGTYAVHNAGEIWQRYGMPPWSLDSFTMGLRQIYKIIKGV